MNLKDVIVKFRWPVLIVAALVSVFMGWELSNRRKFEKYDAGNNALAHKYG